MLLVSILINFVLVLRFLFCLMLILMMLDQLCLQKLFIAYLRLLIDLFQTEMRIGTPNHNGLGYILNVFMGLGLAVFRNFHNGRAIQFFLSESLLGVGILGEFIDVQLVDSIVSAIAFGDGLSVFLE